MLISCCSAYSIIKCCYCQQSEKRTVNIFLANSASIGYRLKIEVAADGVYLHCKINSWFDLIFDLIYFVHTYTRSRSSTKIHSYIKVPG